MSEPAFAQPRLPRRITVDEYHRMLEVGILREGDPVELLDGVIEYKDRSARGEAPMSIGKRHSVVICRLVALENRLRRHRCHIRIQLPLTFPPHQEPEPDGAVVRGKSADYLKRHPGAGDVACVIEVADSSLGQDRIRKAGLYALAGVPQYIIVNLVDDRVEVLTQPRAKQGKYAQTVHLEAGTTLSLNCGGGRCIQVRVRDLLP